MIVSQGTLDIDIFHALLWATLTKFNQQYYGKIKSFSDDAI